jgi:hypothetical protein
MNAWLCAAQLPLQATAPSALRLSFSDRRDASAASVSPIGARDALSGSMVGARDARAAEPLNGADPGRCALRQAQDEAPGSAPLHPAAARRSLRLLRTWGGSSRAPLGGFRC